MNIKQNKYSSFQALKTLHKPLLISKTDRFSFKNKNLGLKLFSLSFDIKLYTNALTNYQKEIKLE